MSIKFNCNGIQPDCDFITLLVVHRKDIGPTPFIFFLKFNNDSVLYDFDFLDQESLDLPD